MATKIFLMEDERRDWGLRIAGMAQKGQKPPAISRRYLVLATDADVRRVIAERFRVLPYGADGRVEIFYCIAVGSSRRRKDFIKSLQHFFSKYFGPSAASEVQILEGMEAARSLMESFAENLMAQKRTGRRGLLQPELHAGDPEAQSAMSEGRYEPM